MYNVAIIGSGPSGLFLAKNLLKCFPDSIKIDIFERISAPMGLLKFGVAPDQPEVKKKFLRHFDSVLNSEKVNLLLNMNVGDELTVSELSQSYDVVALCTGMSNSKRNWLGMPGCYGADEIFGWYNSNPTNALLNLDLSQVKRLIIIGNGNVALDVARIFAKKPNLFSSEDIDKKVLSTLENSAIHEISCLGRRDLKHASFTPGELREFCLLNEYCQFNVQPSLDSMDCNELTRIQSKNYQILKKLVDNSFKNFPLKVVNFMFSSLIDKINGKDKEAYFSTRIGQDIVIKSLKYDLLIECTGFEQRQKFKGLNQDFSGKFQTNEDFRVQDNIYACGWSRTGPKGTIADSMMEAFNCAQIISKDLHKLKILN